MSNKKNLLNETQIRQFMKLASLQPLTPGFVSGLTERVEEDLEEGTEEEIDESAGRGSNEYNKPGQRRSGGGEPVAELVYRDEDEGLESEFGEPEDDLDAGDPLAGEEDVELDGAEDVDMGVEVETSLTIRQVVSAIEAALEELLPNEEVDAEYVGDDDMDVEVEDEFAPEGDVVDDVEIDAEEELQESDEEEITTEATTDELVEQITKRVAARILKSALAKK